MTKVSDMTSEERTALVQQIADKAKEHGLGGSVNVYREDVTVLMAGAKETSMRISYEKKMSPEHKDKVEACKAELLEITKDIQDVKIDLGIEVGVGQ